MSKIFGENTNQMQVEEAKLSRFSIGFVVRKWHVEAVEVAVQSDNDFDHRTKRGFCAEFIARHIRSSTSFISLMGLHVKMERLHIMNVGNDLQGESWRIAKLRNVFRQVPMIAFHINYMGEFPFFIIFQTCELKCSHRKNDEQIS